MNETDKTPEKPAEPQMYAVSREVYLLVQTLAAQVIVEQQKRAMANAQPVPPAPVASVKGD